jgi:branched-chain amino acid transport system ATP-binding protein
MGTREVKSAGPDAAPTPGAPALRIDGVAAGYDQTQVLHEVTLTIPAGAVVALIGPNGAGKSTLLKVASGLIKPDKGSVQYLGQDVTRLTPSRRSRMGLCHIPEGRAVYRQLSVRENLLMQSRRGAEAESIERAVSAFPRLGERLRQYAGTLSGGEQQMLAMARAYIHEQRVILVDEPSLGLAPMLVEAVFEFLDRVRAQQDAAVLIVDQFVDRVLEMAQFAYVMRRGSIVFEGTADKLRGTDIFAHYLDDGGIA